MSKTRKLRPADRHITRAECQALIVHTLNEVFGKLAPADVCVPGHTGPCGDPNPNNCGYPWSEASAAR